MNNSNIANLIVKYFKLLLLAVILVIPVSYLACRIGNVSYSFQGFAKTYIYWRDYQGALHIDDDIFQFLGITYIIIIVADFLIQLIKWTLKNKTV